MDVKKLRYINSLFFEETGVGEKSMVLSHIFIIDPHQTGFAINTQTAVYADRA